jgi:CHAD domain-containing protein
LSGDQSVSEAFAAIMRHSFDHLSEWEDPARTWDDIEGVHQLRVTFRRMRSALSLFRAAIAKSASLHWAQEMRWVAGELGPARDLDVFISEGLGGIASKLPLQGEESLRGLAERRRVQVYEQKVRPMLDSLRYREFKEGFRDWYEGRRWEQGELKKKQSRYLKMQLTPFARQLLDKQERRVLGAGSHVNRDDASELHRLRIECKKLRYAAEFFRPLFPEMDTFITHMKGLQDLLGVMNDIAVTRNLLDDLLSEETDHQVLVYAGGLIGWRTCDFYHMLDRFDGFWEEFTEAKHPWWRKSAPVKPAA